MKPRLEPCPETDEDYEAFTFWCVRRELQWGMWLTERSRQSDRHDADLMYYAQTNGRLGYVVTSASPLEHVWVRAPSAWNPIGAVVKTVQV